MIIAKKLYQLMMATILCMGMGLFAAPEPAQAQAGTPSEMLQEINNLRVVNGLAAMQVNNYLMLSAQNHADWIAATGLGGHTGEGGNTPTDRAHAVGYPGAIVTENWARGPGLTVYNCIFVSWNDPDHMNNMLDPKRKEFGAGVALDARGFTVYVVNFSIYDTDGDQPNAPTLPTVTPGGPTVTTAPLILPLTQSTPQPDGTIVHIVQYGQTLWAIADAYKVPLADILALNSLTLESILYPDQELIIKQGTGETPQVTATPGEVKPTSTPRPTSTPTKQPEPTVTAMPTETPRERGNFLVNIFSGDTLWVGIGLVAVSVLGIALLFYTSSRLR